jgi:hypothetical protein
MITDELENYYVAQIKIFGLIWALDWTSGVCDLIAVTNNGSQT